MVRQTTPTLTGLGVDNPSFIAIDHSGKIFLTFGSSNMIKAYNPDGTPALPVITTGLDHEPDGIALH